MTDTTAPALTWAEAFRGLLPSLNTALVAIVTAILSVGGTILTQRLTAKPAEPAKVQTVTVERVIEKSAPVDLGPLTAKVEEALKEFRAAQPTAGKPKRTPLK